MARYQATLTSPDSREAVFDYLADFRSAAEWDPGVKAARLRGPLRLFDPVLQVLFNRIGDNARAGLAEKLAQPLTERHGARAA